MPEEKKGEKEDKEYEVGNASDLFGITEKEADEVMNQMRELKQKSETFPELAEKSGLTKSGIVGFKAYLIGRMVADNEKKHSLMELIGGLASKG